MCATASCTMPARPQRKPKTMPNMMNAAIPPFDNMWIEWDEDERADNMLSGVRGNVSSRVGWEAIEHPTTFKQRALR